MPTIIHPTAIVDPKAQLGVDVEIGPHSIIEAGVSLGDRTRIGPLVHIQGTTTLGADNQVYTGATLGFPPQYLGFDGSPTRLVIGDRNVIREYVSIHRGLNHESETRIGDDCFLMATAHVAHDCQIGNRVILVNGVLLAGHVTVGDRANLSGNAVFHQFVRIGAMAMVSGLSWVNKDVPPFALVEGHPARVRGLNSIGMKRAGIAPAARLEIKRVLRQVNAPGRSHRENAAALDLASLCPEARLLAEFYLDSKRGVLPMARAGAETPGDAADAD
ncbi:MAG TPA: acyl-ACP--UDP-N-acetylglucosamine O-acyltransferase [Candidatus Sumerlaeota bacterium]|nr:acyl-ACP--UDP-N-acetylglucosamine O-acyltransferase [Candidatus Sumerlaeota bacterium]HOR26950.1 acyl-ACP--UDP-N-acetylglucosamine O-acyltransferase [Candidatus Sumerlaeota bacterium]HPK03974.1 acyl-ACP--UDP-N-acetylglucosamine O-acyltransferase [Candidatus Sumerlaeota bacterium]